MALAMPSLIVSTQSSVLNRRRVLCDLASSPTLSDLPNGCYSDWHLPNCAARPSEWAAIVAECPSRTLPMHKPRGFSREPNGSSRPQRLTSTQTRFPGLAWHEEILKMVKGPSVGSQACAEPRSRVKATCCFLAALAPSARLPPHTMERMLPLARKKRHVGGQSHFAFPLVSQYRERQARTGRCACSNHCWCVFFRDRFRGNCRHNNSAAFLNIMMPYEKNWKHSTAKRRTEHRGRRN